MHELSVVQNLLKILEKLQKERNISSFLKINLTVNPLSCIDEENINFVFHSLTKDQTVYKDAKIHIRRSDDPSSREFILDDVEIEINR
ncbi:MAG: hydrogenase maturation nickel metallochaperone HypA [Candidatus Ratteibacteria bacterium]|nr:hydrogenase maturation nickel metallochaperone HypA [Candidatus Ratteibacteria bacterium]